MEKVSNNPERKIRSDAPFLWGLSTIASLYLIFIIALLCANACYLSLDDLYQAATSPAIRQSLTLTFLSCSISAILALLFAVPTGYLLARFHFRGRGLVDALFDIPIILPPLVIGLCLLALFNSFPTPATSLENWLNQHGLSVTYHFPAIILAQFTLAAALACKSMKNTFEQISPRCEQIALTLGCNRSEAFWKVALPQAKHGVLTAGLLAWARAIGEFGPVLLFAGVTRGRTEVLATSIFLEVNIGNLSGAAAVSMILISFALCIIFLVRLTSRPNPIHH